MRADGPKADMAGAVIVPGREIDPRPEVDALAVGSVTEEDEDDDPCTKTLGSVPPPRAKEMDGAIEMLVSEPCDKAVWTSRGRSAGRRTDTRERRNRGEP